MAWPLINKEYFMNNAKIHLTGFLGDDPKKTSKHGKSFTILRMATTDSYPVKDGENTKWIDKETEWHTVFVFSPIVNKFANEMKKSDKLEVFGTITYKSFKDEKGHTRSEAAIIGNYINKIDYNKQSMLFTKEVIEQVAEGLKL